MEHMLQKIADKLETQCNRNSKWQFKKQWKQNLISYLTN